MAVATTAGVPDVHGVPHRGHEVGQRLAGAGAGLHQQVLPLPSMASATACAISTWPGRSVPPTPPTAAWRSSSRVGTRAGYAVAATTRGRPSTGAHVPQSPVAAARGATMGGVSIDVDAPTPFPSDIEIAEAADITPVVDLARDVLGIPAEALVPYGHTKAKVSLRYLRSLEDRPDGHLVLVTAMSPTPAGEGKTTTSVGLADALRRIGEKSVVALREPSMGPVFGIKGGAAGGGYSQVVPMVDINLAFTGDFAAIAAANNLLAAMIDNHLHQGNALDIDPRTVTWKRVVDLNDRALRQIVVGLGGVTNGVPREDGFDIVVASEVMAILCLADSLPDLKRRLGDIVVGYTRGKEQVTARDLQADGAMTVLLRDALAPNLVQTLEHTPAFIHGGPFANIAHGCNSVMATRAALKLGDWVVTEAGFGADLGAEKFIDIKCRASGLRPEVAVVVVTIRALKFHGGRGRGRRRPRGPRRRRRRHDQPAPPPRERPRRLRAHPGRRGQPLPQRHRRRGRPRRADVLARGRARLRGHPRARRRGRRRDAGRGVVEAVREGRATCGSSTTTTSRWRRRPRPWRPASTAPPG